ncbi:MAG: hydroxymethylbilane synthase [Pseudomonadota bacterium]
MQGKTIRIGTRGSPLALAQAYETRSRLGAAHHLGDGAFEIVVIKTTGDRILDRPLAEAGGKGLFTKEIEEALLAGSIDLAVHSMKDMQTALPDGLALGAVLPREDVRDAFVSLAYRSLEEMPAGAIVGTSSLRRQAQLRHRRPDLQVIGFRGNVQTRLQKLGEGVADATFLATAGLRRLGLANRITSLIATDVMLPAVAQGAIGLEIRADDDATRTLIAPLDHAATHLAVTTERAFLARLEGSCRTPIAGLAEIDGDTIRLSGEILSPDGRERHAAVREGSSRDPEALGTALADELIGRAGADFLKAFA